MTKEGIPVEKKSYSLLELTENIKLQIQKTYQRSYWIKAEMNRLNYYPQSGHCYPELVEKKDGKIVAEIRGFLFRNLYEEIDQNFQRQTGKPLGDGIEILMLCRVSFDSKYGLSLYISDIDPSYTLGEMARLREEAVKRLTSEGLLEKNKTTALHFPLRRIAAISVETSKGWRDFTETINKSCFGQLIHVELFPAKLQGDLAVGSIQKALQKIHARIDRFDAVAIIRGGGGETGMDCYDNYELAHAVANMPIPVLSGIGHSTNLTVVELCSFKNLITPTALAQYVLDFYREMEERIDKASKALNKTLQQKLSSELASLNRAGIALNLKTEDRLFNEKRMVLAKAETIKSQTEKLIDAQRKDVLYIKPSRIARAVNELSQSKTNQLERLGRSLADSSKQTLKNQSSGLDLFEEKLKLLDPINVLKRGFSITQINGKSVSSVQEIKLGDEIKTVLSDGEISSTVKESKYGKK
jgi:exodeoxyribonuclease VII large subunit